MVNYLKKAIQTARGIARNPRRKAQRYAAKADRAIARTGVYKSARKRIQKVDKKAMKLAKKAGLKKQYKMGRNYALKKAGIDKIAKGKKGLVSYALRRGERESGGKLRGSRYSKK